MATNADDWQLTGRLPGGDDDSLSAAIGLTRLGSSVVPIPFRKKGPIIKGWQNLRLSESDLPKYFNGARQNVGVILGDASGGLVDVDLDCPEAVAVAPYFLPPTGMAHGRESAPLTHYWYQLSDAGAGPTLKFEDPTLARTKGDNRHASLVELRANGAQTVVPPSTHPSGERCAWVRNGEPARVTRAELCRRVERLAAAALLARYWPPLGVRHQAKLPLAGALERSGWSKKATEEFVTAVITVGGDGTAEQARNVTESTAARLVDGLPATGIPTWEEYFDPRVVEKAVKWLGLKRTLLHETVEHPESAPTAEDDDELGHQLTANLAARICEADSFARDQGGALYVYQDGVYQPGGERHARQRVQVILTRHGLAWTSHRGDEVVKYIELQAPDLWSAPPGDVLTLANGLLRLDFDTTPGAVRCELVPHTPEHLSAVRLPVAYDPEARCPATDAFIASVYPEDANRLAWQVRAAAMLPDPSLQRAVLFWGEGANGKSTELALIKAFVGPRNVAALTLHRLEQDRFAVAGLVGKLVNIAADLPSSELSSTATFKAITGGDSLTGERKFKDSFEFVPHCRLLFSANRPPLSPDDSDAFFRRWLVVPFTRTFEGAAAERQDRLLARLTTPAELSGVLNRALDELATLRSDGFLEPKSVRDANADVRAATDPLSVWLERNVIARAEIRVAKDDLYDEYGRYCTREARSKPSKIAVGKAVKRVFPSVAEGQRTVGGRVNVWCWLGIGVRSRFVDAV